MAPIALNLFSVLGLTPTAPKGVDTGPPIAGGPPLSAAGLQKEVTANEPKPQATQLDLLEQILKWTAPNALSQDASDPLSLELESEFGGEKVKLEVPEVLATINALAGVAPAGVQSLSEPRLTAAIEKAANDESLPETARIVLKVALAAVAAGQFANPGRIANPALNRLTLPDGSAIDPTLDRLALAGSRDSMVDSDKGEDGRIANPALNRLIGEEGRTADPTLNRLEAPGGRIIDSSLNRIATQVADGDDSPRRVDGDARPIEADAERSKAFLSRLAQVYGSRPNNVKDSDGPSYQTLELNLPVQTKSEGRLADPTLARFAPMNPISDRGVQDRTANASTVRPILVNLLSKSRPEQTGEKPQGLEAQVVKALGVSDLSIDVRPLGKPITIVPIANETVEGMVVQTAPVPLTKGTTVDGASGARESIAIEKPKATKEQETVEPDFDALAEVEESASVKPHAEFVRRVEADKPSKQITEVQTQEVRQRVVEQVQELAAMRGRNSVTVRLNPEELGSMTLTVLSAGENVEAKVTASNESVRHALATHRADLVQSIESRGLSLSNFSVGHENRPDAHSQGHGQRHDQDMRQEFARAHNLWTATQEPTTTKSYSTIQTKGVDTLA